MELKIGHVVKRFELGKEIDYEYVIVSTTKTQAKAEDGTRFKISLRDNVTKPHDKCIAEAIIIGYCGLSSRYFLITKGESR